MKGIYKHFKGNHYFVHGVARDCETQEKMVVYASSDGEMYVRSLSAFEEYVNKPLWEYEGPRFVKVLPIPTF